MKRFRRFVLLTLGYLLAIGRVGSRRFKRATRIERRKMIATATAVVAALGIFAATSANAGNELGYNSTVDYSLTFDGTNPIQVADGGTVPTDFTTNFTMEAWIKPGTCTAGRCMIANKEGSWEWAVYNGTIEYAIVTNAGGWAWVATSALVPSNSWSHVVWVKSGTAMKFYVNGVLADDTKTTGQTTTVSNGAFTIGGREGTSDRYIGSMDEVKLWNSVRTPTQILVDMHSYGDGVGPNFLDDSSLVGYYDFNEGPNAGAQIYDRTTPSQHVAVVSGATKPTYSDIKTTAVLGGDTVYTFPRTYITPVGGWTAPTGATRARVLVIAGGGAGGPGQSTGWNGPGGGAGGMRDIPTASMSGVMKVTVGQGGLAAPTNAAFSSTSGQDSFFGAESSVGGGGGNYYGFPGQGQNGGSGAGAMMFGGGSTSASAAGGTGIAGQGNAGGRNASASVSNVHYASGGGGGAGSAGGNATGQTGGAAGNGAVSNITGVDKYYAGGGAGAGYTTQGTANTSFAATPVGTTPTANTGSGGAGGRNAGTEATPGASGVVIVRYSPQVDRYLSRTSQSEARYQMASAGPIPTGTTDAMTLEAWIRPKSHVADGYYAIMAQQTASDDNWGTSRIWFGVRNGILHFILGTASTFPQAKIPDNAWTHVAVTVSGSNAATVKIYIDSQLVYFYNNWSRTSLGSYFAVGASPQLNDYDWLGDLDQVKIWNSALSEDEIRASMNAYQAPGTGNATAANLKVHYDFNEVSSTNTLLDRSSVGGASDATTSHTSPSFVENIETASKPNSRNAVRFTRNYLTAAGGWTVPAGAARVDALVVAGGGGGGAHVGAGGGAGGFIEKPVSLIPGSVIPIQVGQGGGGGMLRETTWAQSGAGEAYVSRYGSATGNNSILGTSITANGGGRGANWAGTGETGGSGGGSNYVYTSGGAAIAGQGNAGGYSSGASYNATDPYPTGGGGGAGGVGGSPSGTTFTSGAGGIGKISNLWTSNTYYAGGGGGGFHTGGTGGAGGAGGGGAGQGGFTTATILTPGSGTPNTGGGGGGSGAPSGAGYHSMGGNGGSGVIVLSYGGYLDLSNAPKARRANQAFDAAPIIKIKNNDGSQLSGASHTVTLSTGTIGNLTFNGTALSAPKTITASDGVFDFTGLGFAAGVTTAQELTFSSPDFVDLQITVAPRYYPTSVQIVADASVASTAGYFDSTGQFYADAAASTNIRVSDLNAAIASTDVRIDATGTISVDTAANTSASANALTMVAGTTLTVSTGNSLRTGGATSLTGTSVTINGPLTTSGTTMIYSNSTTGVNTIAADVKNLGLNARTTFKSVGANSNTAAATIQTNKGALVFWADSDGSQAGFNRTQHGSVFNTVNGTSTDTPTDGGDIVFAGGSTIDASDYPSSSSWGDGTYSGFDSGYGNTNKTFYYTGGGDFIVRGSSANSLDAVVFQSAVQVWANSGQIDITGTNTSNGVAIQIQRAGNTTQSEFFSSSGTAPAIAFTAISNTGLGFLSGNNLSTANVINIQATGAGGITIIGNGGGSDVFDIGINSTNILSVGPIAMTTQGVGVNGGLFPGRLFNNYASTFSTLGYCATATCTGSRVTTTSADITVISDRVASWASDINLKVNTTGAVVFQPNRSTGFHQFTSLGQGLAFSEDASSVTIGKDQTTDTYTVEIYSNIKINGPIRLYGGRVNIFGNLESTRAGSEIRAKSNGRVYVYLSKTIKTNGGDVVFWSNADKVAGTIQDGGTIWLEDSSSIATNGGKIWLAGGLDDGGADASITSSRGKWASVDASDGLPDGYAVGSNQADEWAIGVYLDAAVSLKSAGGDIFIAGAHGPTSGIGYAHILVKPGVVVDSGTGRVAMWAKSPVGSNVSTQGIALNYGSDSTPVVITSHAPTEDAITIYSDSSESSGSWSRGLTAIWNGANSGTRGYQGVHILATAAQGGITITGIGGGSSTSSDAVGLRFDYIDILAKSGPIVLNGLSSSSASSQGVSVGRDNGGNSALRLGGWHAGTTGAVGGGSFVTSAGTTDFTASTSPVTINADSVYMYEGGKGTIFGTTGAVNILPITNSSGIATATANFKRVQTDAQWRFGQTSFPIAAASFTLGRATTTTDIAYYGAVTSSGPITLHGGNLTVAGNFTVTGLDERVLLKAKVSIAQTSASTIRTNSGKIVLWANSDNSAGGNMTLAGTLCSAPTATTCNTNATTGGDDIILGGGAADANDSTLPGGFASGTGTGSDATASGVQLGTLQVANSGTRIYSSGGNIKIQSQTVSSASALSVWALGLVVVSGTELNSGSGKIDINVVVAAPSSTSFLAAAEFNAWGGGTTKFISTNTASDSISIKVNNPSGVGSSKVFGGNAGTSFTNANGGGLLLQTNWVDPALKATLAITGPVVIEPVATSFVNDALNLDSDYSFSANPAGLRIGKPGNTLDVTVGIAVTSTGAIQLYGGNVTANADLRVTNANEILLKAMDDVVVGAGTDAATRRVVSTFGGPITLWSNADFSGTGAIVTNNYNSFLSRGGKITMAGSASANEVSPTGFAVGSASVTSYKVSAVDKAPGAGIRLASSAVASNLTISSDGGDILIQGSTSRNVSDAMGVIQYGGTTIDSGAGAIKIHGRASSTTGSINGHGMELGFSATAPTLITSSKSSDTAIDINGQTSGTSTDAKGVNFWSGDATNYVKISATGTAGNVSISGSATTTTQPGISMNWARVLSKGGSVTLDSGVNPTAFGNNSASGNIYLGADSAAGAAGNVDVNAGSISWAGTVNVRTTGDLLIDSGAAQSFNAALSIPSGALVLAEVNDIRIGTAGTSGATQNSANVTVSSVLTGSGNTEIYGGIVTAAANITGTGLNGSVLLKATGSIVQNTSTTIRTNSGKTVIWADSDEANGGTVTLKGAVCTAPTATTCNASAVTGGDDVIVGGGAPSASDATIPGGYASGTSSSNVDTASGVMFGTTGTFGGAKIYSSGGNVNVAGRTFVTSGTISVFAVGVIFMAETEIHAGLGKIFVEGNNATAAATTGNYRYPLEWNAWGLNKTSQFTSTNADDDSITMRAVETVASNGLHINTGGAEFKNPNGGLLIQTNRFMDTVMATVNVSGPFVFEPIDTSFAATYTFDSDIVWGANVPSAVRIGKSGNAAGINVTQTVRSSGDIEVLGGALSTTASVSSTGGTITYTGASFSNSGVLSTDGQDILVNADQMTIGASITTNKTTAGIVSLVPKTAAKNIDLGAADSGSLLGLTDTELDFVKGKVLRIGNVSYANNINVSANISIDAAKTPTLALRGAGNVTTSNTATINATNLAIAVSGTVSLGGANQISGNLAITAGGASGGSGVTFGGSAYTPGSVDSIDAIFGVGKNISISSAPAIGATEVRYLNQTWSAPPVVTVKDEYGITIAAANSSKSSYTTTVTGSGAPTIAGAAPVLDGGVQTFSNLKFTTQTGSTDLTFTTAGLASGGTSTVTTGTYDVQAGEPASIDLTYDATEAPAGKTGFAIKAALKDAAGNTVSGPHATDAITVDVTDGDADATNDATIISGNTPATVAGVANFSNLKLGGKVSTNYTLTFTVTFVDSTGATQAVSETLVVTLTPGDATDLKVQTAAAGFSSRTTFSTQPAIAVKDAFGNTVTTSNASVSVAVSAVGAASTQGLSGTLTATANAGVATFVGLGKTGLVGTKRLTFSANNLSSDTQDFTLTYGAANKLAMTSPASTVNDTIFGTQPVVIIQDQDGNTVADSTTTVTLTSSNATIGGTLLNSAVAMDAVAGVADFSGKDVKLTGTIGAKNLTATIAGGITLTNQVTITFGAATKLILSRDAADAVNAVAFVTQPQVVVQDISGNVVTNSSASITVVSSGSTLSGNSTPPTLVNGVATFSGLKLTGTKGTYVLTFKSTGLTDASQNITVDYGAATKLVLTTQPLGFVNRTNFTTQPVITVQDVSGNTVENSAVSIDVAIDSGTLTGTTQIAAVNGIATFAGLGKYGTVGAKTLTFTKTGGGLTQATFGFTLTYGAIHHLNVNVANSLVNDTAWATQLVVAIQDEDNNTVDVTDTVTLTASGATTVAIGGTTSMQTTNGVADFAGKGVKLTGLVGSKTLTATITSGNGFAKDTAITLTYGAATRLALTTEPTGFVNRTLFSTQPVVTVQDVSGNTVANSTISIDVTIDSGDVTGTTQVAAVAGVATFSGLGKTGTIGAKVLTFSDAANALTPATKNFTLTHGDAYRVGMVVASTLVNATAFATAPVVTIFDQDDNVVTSGSQSSQTVTLSATGATAVALGGAVTMDAFDGVADFAGKGVKLTGLVGAKSLTATVASPVSIAKTETVTLTYGAATKLAISTDAADASNGGQFGTQPVILVQDVSGNLVTNSTVQVVATVSNGTLDGTDSVAAIGGVVTFTDLGLTATAGSKTLTFSSSPLTAVSQSILAVTGAPSQLRIDAAGSLINNTVFATQPVVTLLDATGNVVSVGGYAAQTVTLSSPDATIGGTVSMQSNAGVADFSGKSVKLTGLVGARSLVATISSPNSVTATATVNITFGAAHHLNIASAASGAANRIAFTNQPAIEVLDISGNRVDDSTAQISVAATGANGAVLGGDTSMNATAGVAYFNLNANKLKLTGQIGTYTLTYSSGVLSADSEDIELTHGVATKIVVSRAAAGAKAGQAFTTQPKVQIQDADSNLVTTGLAATASIRMAVSADAYDSAAHTGVNLVGPANFATVAATAGEATFAGARLEGVIASAYALDFEVVNTAGFNGLAVSQNIALTAGTETHLEVVQQPTAIIAGAAFSPVVTVEILDAWNNRVLDVANTVTVKPTLVDDALASNALDSTKTAVANAAGLVTFTGLTFTKAGNQFIQFTSTGLVSTTSVGFTITNAVAHHLVWVTSPVGARNDFAIKGAANANPELEIRDQYENPVVTGAATSVDVTEITSSADVISISGASARNAAGSSRVIFDNLVMRAKVGSYNLRFTAANGALPINGTFIDSNAAVAISFGEPAALPLTRNAAGANAGAPFATQPKLNIEDTAGNLVADSALSVSVTETETQVLGGTRTIAAVGGSIDFTDSGMMLSGDVATGLTLKYAITFNSTEISTTQSINLNPGLAVAVTIGQQPTTTKTRVAFTSTPTVVLRDASGNQVTTDSASTVTAQLKDSDGNPVGAETSAYSASSGLVTFTGLAFQAPAKANYYVTYKLVSNGAAVTSSAFEILPGEATELRITRQPSTLTVDQTAGKTGELLSTQPIVKLYDQDGNLVTTANSGVVTVRVQSTDAAGDLSEGTVTANISGGVATFAGVKFVGTPGVSYALDFATATPNPALTSLASNTISVTHNDATHLVVTRAAAGGRSGMLFTTQPIITIKDRYENTVTSGPDATADLTATAEITAPTPGATDPSNGSATAVDGVATFAALGLTGLVTNTYKLNFDIVGSNTVAGAEQTNVTISYGSANRLAITRQPIGGNATGQHLATQPVIEVRDGAGNRVANSALTVTASINSTAGLTLADGSAARLTGSTKAAVGGVATFDALDLYGLPGTDYTLKFLVNGLAFATSNAIQVDHAAAHHLTIAGQPAGGNPTGANLAGQPVIQLRDAFENIVSGDSTDVVTARLSTTSARESLTGNTTATFANGVVTFAGLKVIALPETDYTLDFVTTVGGSTLTSAASNTFTVTYATATQLAVYQQPVAGTTGTQLTTQPIIEVQDFYGNRVRNFNGVVTASVGGSAVTLTNSTFNGGGNSLAVSVTDGRAAFTGLELTGTPATNYQLTFDSNSLTSVNSSNIQVTPGAPVRIEIVNQPIGAQTAAALAGQPVVKIVDSFGNTVTQNSSAVITATLTSGVGGTLTRVVSGNSVPVTATVSNGVATFSDLFMRGLTNRNYRMTFSSGDLASAVSANYQVSHASITQLVWNTQPTVGMTGSPITRAAVLELQDLDGNIADTDNSTVVTAVVTSGSGSSPLQNATATAVNGVVTFNTLTLTGTPGTAYKLTFTAAVGSTSFSAPATDDLVLAHAIPAKLTMRGGNVTGGLTGQNLTSQPTLYVRDRFDNVATSDNATVVTASILNDVTGAVSGTVTATAVNGEVSFSGLKASGVPGTAYTLRFAGDWTGTTLTAVNSNTFTVSKRADVSLAYTAQQYVPAGVVNPIFATDSPGLVTYSTATSSTICSLNASTGAITINGVGTCAVRVDVAATTYYLAHYAEASLVISKANQSPITITSAGAVDFWSNLTPMATGGSGTGSIFFATNGTCRLIGTTLLPGEAGSLCQLTATRLGDANYLPESSATQTITVRKLAQATLSIASAPTMIVGDLDLFTAGGSGSGAVTFAVNAGDASRCSIAGTTLTASASGNCRVTATKAASTNYDQSNVAAMTIVVSKDVQNVAFTSTAPSFPIIRGSYVPTAVATSALPVTFSLVTSNSTPACEFDATIPTKVNFLAAGDCEVVASQVGSARYAAATASQLIVVGVLNQTIRFETLGDLSFGTPAFQVAATSNSGLDVAIATTNNSVACSVSNLGLVSLTGSGLCELRATQAGNSIYSAATPVIRSFIVSADLAGAPHIFSSSATTHAFTASFTAPSYTGGSPITSYALIVTDANGNVFENAACPAGSSTITCTIVGLANDISYTAVARAITVAGMGAASNTSMPQTPLDAPLAVTNLTAATNNNDLVVNWTAPTALDSTFTRYEIFVAPIGSPMPSTPTAVETNVAATSTTIANIVAGASNPSPSPSPSATTQSARIRRASVNQAPQPSPSSSSQSSAAAGYQVSVVTITQNSSVASNQNTSNGVQTGFSVPLSPSRLTVDPVGTDLFISWSAPTADGGSALIGYDVKVNGAVICANTSLLACVFNGMLPGQTYLVEVFAKNAIGSGVSARDSHATAALPATGWSGSSATANGMAILSGSTKVALTTGGQLYTLKTRNFAGVTSVTIGGKLVKIVSNSEDQITLELPAHSAGPVDLVFKSPRGTIVYQQALTFVLPPKAAVTQQFSRFKATVVVPGPRMVASIQQIVKSDDKPKAATCVGYVPAKYSAFDVSQAKRRAANACAVVAKLDGTIVVRSTTAITKLTGPAARMVKITYKY